MPSAVNKAAAAPARVRVRYPGAWPLRFGDYATNNVIHEVDAALAARLMARGFVRVDPDQPIKSQED
jgi:hypothetical protein